MYFRIVTMYVGFLLFFAVGSFAFKVSVFPAGRRRVGNALKAAESTTPELSIFDQLVMNILSALPQALAPAAPMDESRLVHDPAPFSKATTASGWAKKSHSSNKKGFNDIEMSQKFTLKYSGWSPPTAEGKLAKLKELLEELQAADMLDRVDEFISSPLGLGMDLDEASLYDALNAHMKRRGGGGTDKGMSQGGVDFDDVAFEDTTGLHRTAGDDVKEPMSDRPLLLSESSKVHAVDDAEIFLVEGLRQSFAPLDATVDPLKITPDASPFRRPIKLSALSRLLRKDPSYFKR